MMGIFSKMLTSPAIVIKRHHHPTQTEHRSSSVDDAGFLQKVNRPNRWHHLVMAPCPFILLDGAGEYISAVKRHPGIGWLAWKRICLARSKIQPKSVGQYHNPDHTHTLASYPVYCSGPSGRTIFYCYIDPILQEALQSVSRTCPTRGLIPTGLVWLAITAQLRNKKDQSFVNRFFRLSCLKNAQTASLKTTTMIFVVVLKESIKLITWTADGLPSNMRSLVMLPSQSSSKANMQSLILLIDESFQNLSKEERKEKNSKFPITILTEASFVEDCVTIAQMRPEWNVSVFSAQQLAPLLNLKRLKSMDGLVLSVVKKFKIKPLKNPYTPTRDNFVVTLLKLCKISLPILPLLWAYVAYTTLDFQKTKSVLKALKQDLARIEIINQSPAATQACLKALQHIATPLPAWHQLAGMRIPNLKAWSWTWRKEAPADPPESIVVVNVASEKALHSLHTRLSASYSLAELVSAPFLETTDGNTVDEASIPHMVTIRLHGAPQDITDGE